MSDSLTDSHLSSELISEASQDLSDNLQFASGYLETDSKPGTFLASFETIRSKNYESVDEISSGVSREDLNNQAFPGLLEARSPSSNNSSEDQHTKNRSFTFLQKSTEEHHAKGQKGNAKPLKVNLSQYKNLSKLPSQKSSIAEYERQCMITEIKNIRFKIQEKEKKIQSYLEETKDINDEYNTLKESLDSISIQKYEMRKNMRQEVSVLQKKLDELQEENFTLNLALSNSKTTNKKSK